MVRSLFHSRLLVAGLVTFIIFLFTTFFAWFVIKDVAKNELRSVFSRQSNSIKHSIESRFNLYTTITYGVKGFFEGSDDVTAEKWSAYVRQLNLKDRYPGVNSMAFAQRVQEGENDHFIVKYVEPLERSAAIGSDMASEPTRLVAINRSIETGKISITDRILLASDDKPGFIMLIPIYKSGDKTNVQGLAVLTFNSELAFKTVYGRRDPFPDLNFKLYRSEERKKESLLYDHDPKNPLLENSYKPEFITSSTIKVNGEVLILDIATKPGFSLSPSAERLPAVVLISGLIVSFLFLVVFLYNFREHLSAHRKSADQESP